jgi:hypothetical protein
MIPLPNGQTALLRDSAELSNADVKTLRRAARKVGVVGQKLREMGLDDLRDVAGDATEMSPEAQNKAMEILASLSDDEDDALDLFQRTCVIVRLSAWSLDQPLPTTVEEVDKLSRPIYGVLTTEAAKLDLNEQFGLDGAVDPKADTESSSDSGTHLEVVSS